MCSECQRREIKPDDDGVRWLALLLRQGLKIIIAGIDGRYGESERDRKRREREHRQEQRAA